jgi:hypothetical protein
MVGFLLLVNFLLNINTQLLILHLSVYFVGDRKRSQCKEDFRALFHLRQDSDVYLHIRQSVYRNGIDYMINYTGHCQAHILECQCEQPILSVKLISLFIDNSSSIKIKLIIILDYSVELFLQMKRNLFTTLLAARMK